LDELGIADLDGIRIAWVTDPDHQVISIVESQPAPMSATEAAAEAGPESSR
jgi:hypothetical protein